MTCKNKSHTFIAPPHYSSMRSASKLHEINSAERLAVRAVVGKPEGWGQRESAACVRQRKIGGREVLCVRQRKIGGVEGSILLRAKPKHV